MTSKSSRRLAAIMFTDIVGYTALMGQNEQDALEILERNRKIHNMLISRFNGKLLKEMGDGIMASFTNTYSAIMCAAAIQKESQKQGYQLKIGLHEGDVVEKNGDIFGEGVNIASRVEALADPEQILITETIYRNIHNKPGIITELLGEKYLKNVSDSWKIYASYVDEKTLERELMIDHNPVTEDKKTVLKGLIKWLVIGFVGLGAGGMLWMNVSSSSKVEGFTAHEVQLLRDKTITVLPFTGPESEWLDKFGEMAPYWISKSLVEVTDGKVIDHPSAEKVEDIEEEFIRTTGLNAVIVGHYFFMDKSPEDLELFVDLIDLSTMEKRSLGHFIGSSAEPQKILEEVTQKIMSIWALSGRKRWADNPPRYDAFREYKASEDSWVIDYDKSIDHCFRAYQLDTTFHEALLKVATAYGNMGKRIEQDSILKYIYDRRGDLDPWTEMRFDFATASLNGQLLREREIAYKMAEFDPKDVTSIYNSMLLALRTGYAGVALEYSDMLLALVPDIECRPGGQTYGIRFGSYFMLGKYENIIEESNSLKCIPTLWHIRAYPLKACVRLERFEMIDTILGKYIGSSGGMRAQSWLNEQIVKELFMTGNTDMLRRYAEKLKKSTHGYEHWGQFFSGDFSPPIEKLKARIQQDSSNYFNWGHLAFMLANSGKTTEVEKMLGELKMRPEVPFDHGDKKYYLGLLQALLGEKELATNFLKDAYAEGKGFGWQSYDDDFRLFTLFDYPPFQEFVKPKASPE